MSLEDESEVAENDCIILWFTAKELRETTTDAIHSGQPSPGVILNNRNEDKIKPCVPISCIIKLVLCLTTI
jgi:hypothetical protein